MVVGPTAVGKTAVSIPLAQRIRGEIVSADSRLFYKGMDIGTAKPTRDEMALVPHHLIDISPPDENWSLSDYKAHAHRVIGEIHSQGKIPLLVGGTGQYITAVLEGWQLPGPQADFKLRTVLENWEKEIGSEGLHHRLSLVDPVAARSIDHRNVRRTVRALEVIFTTGDRFSCQRKKQGSIYSILVIGLRRPRHELYQIIDLRIEEMIRGGLIEEVQTLLEAGYPENLPAFSAIGYQQIIYYLKGLATLEESIQSIKRYSRQYVRRQDTWFKQKDPRIHWLDVKDGILDDICLVIGEKENWILPENQTGDG